MKITPTSRNRILNIISFTAITVFPILIFWQSLSAPAEVNFVYFILLLLIFLTASEILGKIGGIYVALVIISLYFLRWIFNIPVTSVNFDLLAYAEFFFFTSYFVIRLLSKRKFERTYAREKHFRTLANFNLQPLILSNEKGEILFASESIKNLLGLRKNLEIGKNIIDLIFPADEKLYAKFLATVVQKPFEKTSLEHRMMKNGSGWIWVRQDTVNLLQQENIRAIVTSIQDISFQKELDREKYQIIMQEKKARSDAEKAVRDRDEFFSIASHELKTPLTTVILQLQATLRKISTQSLVDFSGQDLMKSLQIAEKQAQSLSTLIKDLLNLSLASTGRLTLNKEQVDLSSLTESLLTKYDAEIKLSGCQLSKQIKDTSVLGSWDPVRLEQAMTNILINALKYAQGKSVKVEVKKIDDRWAIFEVQDSGPGISEEDQKLIFEPFVRGNTNTKGLGVGLFITKQIALAHGGDISVKSKLGKGSTFTLRLPLN